jgi:hypothetical protein
LEENSLPEPLKPLATRQAAQIYDRQWRGTVDDLILRLLELPGMAVEPPSRERNWKPTIATGVVLTIIVAIWIVTPRLFSPDPSSSSTPATPEKQLPADDDLFNNHQVIGEYWHESAFNSYVQFIKGGKLSGTYYQYTLTGTWGPLSKERVRFSPHLVEQAPGVTFGFESWMTAEVSGDTLKVTWPERKVTSYWNRTALPK